jgi:hypothetical protein
MEIPVKMVAADLRATEARLPCGCESELSREAFRRTRDEFSLLNTDFQNTTAAVSPGGLLPLT